MNTSGLIMRAGITAGVAGIAMAASGQTITGLGVFPGGANSGAAAVSADGLTVTGYSETASLTRAFRWTRAGGTQQLDMGTTGLFGAAGNAISANGGVIAGDGYASTMWRIFRWSVEAGMDFGGGPSDSSALGVSGDGSLIVGFSGSTTRRATLWADGQAQYLGLLPGGSSSAASAISTDGSAVAGYSDIGNGANHAFRWTAAGGLQDLGTLGGASSYAMAISADGSVVAGFSLRPNAGEHAFRWTAAGGMQDLGLPPGSDNAYANAISGDGAVVAGACDHGSGPLVAFIWTNTRGMMDLNAYLPTRGVNLAGWSLRNVYGLSADGLVIVGEGAHNGHVEAFVVSLRSCGSADFNDDGDTGTDADIDAFFACLSGTCCPTCGSVDFNGDGDVGTDADIEAFFRVLSGGAC